MEPTAQIKKSIVVIQFLAWDILGGQTAVSATLYKWIQFQDLAVIFQRDTTSGSRSWLL